MTKIRAQLPVAQDGLTRSLGVSVAAIIVLLLTAHLYSFEALPGLLAGALDLDISEAGIVASVLVAAELFSLPFLLGMAVSKLMRIVSILAGICVLTFWFAVGIYTQLNDEVLMNVGIVGNAPTMSGWWLVVAMSAVIVAFLWYLVRAYPIKLKRA